MDYRDQFYKNYYQTQASRYSGASEAERIREAQTALTKEVLPLLPLGKDVSILELGCGHGTLLSLLQKSGYAGAKGIDISADQVEKAQDLGVENVQCSDIEKYLSNSTESYDVIIGIDIIEHLTKSELLSILELIRGRLNPGGRVIFRTPNCDAPLGTTFYFGDFTHDIYLNYFSAEQIMLTMRFKAIQIAPSYIGVSNPLKNFFRAILWFKLKVWWKMVLFASGRSSKKVIFTPNLIISAEN